MVRLACGFEFVSDVTADGRTGRTTSVYALLNATLFPHYNAFRNDLLSISGTCPARGPLLGHHEPSMNSPYDLGILPVSY